MNGSIKNPQAVDDAANQNSALSQSLLTKNFDVHFNSEPTARQNGIANTSEARLEWKAAINKWTNSHARLQVTATKSAKRNLLAVVSSLAVIF